MIRIAYLSSMQQTKKPRQAIQKEETMATNTGHAEMPYRVLGSTGERVSAIGLGGWHLGLKHVDEPLSIRIVRDAIDRGINFMDNCWDYNDGASEIRMGKALRDGYRQQGLPDDQDRRALEKGSGEAAR